MSNYISIQKSKQRAKSLNGGFFAKEYLKYLLEITNVVRLLCGSYKIRGKRISNPVVYTGVCDICGKRFVNPVDHALLHCSASYDKREKLWNWIVDSFAVEQTVYLVAVSDLDFILIILGQNRETLGLKNKLRKSFLLKSANYISYCFNRTVISI